MSQTQAQEIVAADIGGTHARFALASVAKGRVRALGEAVTFKVADYASLQLAWRAFAATLGREPPRAAALAVAGPVRGDVLKFTNSPWVLRPASLAQEIGVEKLLLINDFGAIGHAVAQIPPDELIHIAGPRQPFSRPGVVSIIGPGTGLGVALLLLDCRRPIGWSRPKAAMSISRHRTPSRTRCCSGCDSNSCAFRSSASCQDPDWRKFAPPFPESRRPRFWPTTRPCGRRRFPAPTLSPAPLWSVFACASAASSAMWL